MEVQLANWLHENQPKETMLWKDRFWNNVCFIRDVLGRVFETELFSVVGEHSSKSIMCPVISMNYKGVEVLWQFNFYDWQIMVKSENDLDIKEQNLFKFGDYFYYQGISKDYCFKPYSETNKKHFAVSISEEYYLALYPIYGFACQLKNSIDNLER